MSDLKNIVESYERQVAPKWDKNKNWAKISNQISKSSNIKNRKTNLLLLFLTATIFSIFGFFLGKTYSSSQKIALKQDKTNINENKIQRKYVIHTDTFFIMQSKTDTIYKLKPDYKSQNISLDSIKKPYQNEFASLIINTENRQQIDYSAKQPIDSLISISQQNELDSMTTIDLNSSEKNTRTRKKYAETVHFKDVIKKPKHDFRFINHVPNFNCSTSKYAHGQ